MVDDWYEKVFENKHDEINEFLRQKEAMGRSLRTLNAYSRTLRKFYHEQFPELTPAETEVRHIEEYLHELSERDLSQNTKRRYLESLSSFFSYAMKRPRFEEIPKLVHDRPDCATWENAKKIVHEIADPRDKSVAVLLAKTGCRLTAALEIKQDDLMLEEGFIRLRKRKGRKQTVVPVDDEVIKSIRRLQKITSGDDIDYFFVSIRGHRLSRERIRVAVRQAAIACGVMEDDETRFHRKLTPHTFRTVFTTLMRQQGMDDRILKYIRGDSSDQTMDVYTRVDRGEAREQYLDCISNLDL
ncbi:tyrosine-type recombinase/integrase [Haloarcula hispanica]|uniref:Integrase n=1 Tax=Haloarcula hispanica TaxID=51589 RepID=A0A482T736_HALHI|nr:tyrosine-type recombinase/integrase [Haloarcula hispanica]MCJ0619721.1 tyrosine-type recombinase/integrase [Haloarcula hispanica]RYJ10182.1 integrase [Haloarcula hispanica]